MVTLRHKITWSDLGPELKARLSKSTNHDNGHETPPGGSLNARTRSGAVNNQAATKSKERLPANV